MSETATISTPAVRPSGRTLIDPALGQRISREIARITADMGPAMPGLQQVVRALGCTDATVDVDADHRQMFADDGQVVGLLYVNLELAYIDGAGRPCTSGEAVDGRFEGKLDARGAFTLTCLHIHFDALLD